MSTRAVEKELGGFDVFLFLVIKKIISQNFVEYVEVDVDAAKLAEF